MITARSNGILIKKKPFKVLICLATAMAFLCNTVLFDASWAVGTPSELPGGSSERAGGSGLSSSAKASEDRFKELHVDTFTLPEDLGRIKDQYKANNPDKIVIHIQDAHCNYAAQQKISKIIEYLNKEYGISTVNLEGGARGYDLSVFTGIADKAIRNKVADYFVKEGLVNGAEYFAVNNPEKVNLWGIEDTKLYIDNLKIYRDSLAHKGEVDKHLNTLTHILSNLKSKIYSQELLEFDMKYGSYKSNKIEFKDYLRSLITIAKSKTIDIKSLPDMYLLNQALGEEGGIDFRKANKERDDLIDRLQKKLSKNALEELVLKTVDFRSEKMSQKNFYSYLTTKAKDKEIALSEFPELQKYIVYISMYDAIDKAKVMEEIDTLENKVRDALCRNDQEKQLSILSKDLSLLKNIFGIALTKDDYKYYKSNEGYFDVRNFTTFINKNAPLYKITAKLDDNAQNLDQYRKEIGRFYEYSLKRDDAFLKNMQMTKPSIIVTGGFHTENLAELFKKQNISYISIIPNFRNCDGYQCPYFNLLGGKEASVLQKLQPIFASVSSIQIASMLSGNIAPEVWGKDNVGAFRAAVYVQSLIEQGNKVQITKDGNPVAGLEFGEGKVTSLSVEELLKFTKAIEQGSITTGLPQAPEAGPATTGLPKTPEMGPMTTGLPKAPNLGPATTGLPQAPESGPTTTGLPTAPEQGPAILAQTSAATVPIQMHATPTPEIRARVTMLLKDDMPGLMAKLASFKVTPAEIDAAKAEFIRKAGQIDPEFGELMGKILENYIIKNGDQFESVVRLAGRLNEYFLSLRGLDLYIEVYAEKGRLAITPAEIVSRRAYKRDDGSVTEALVLRQLDPKVRIAKLGHNTVGEKFVCISRDMSGMYLNNALRCLQGGKYYEQGGGLGNLWVIEDIARRVVNNEFAGKSPEEILSAIESQTELHELKHNENDINGTRERLKSRHDEDAVNEILADLTSLALGRYTHFTLLHLLERVATPEAVSPQTEYILRALSQELRLGVRYEGSDSAKEIVDRLLYRDKDIVRKAARKIYDDLAKQVGAGQIEEGVIQKAVLSQPFVVSPTPAPTAVTVTDVNLAAGGAQKVLHNQVNDLVKDNLPIDLKDNPVNIKNYRRVEGYGVGARVVPIRGLFKATRQFAHIGLGQVYGEPVIYVDQDFVTNQIVLNHELYEISKWEQKRKELGLQPQQMRQWIITNLKSAKLLAGQWHSEAPSLEPLVRGLRYNYLSGRYHLHGTNAYALLGMLKAGGKVLAGNALRDMGIIPLSGESGGLTNFNDKVVSTVKFGGQLSTVVRYSDWASGRKKVFILGGGYTSLRVCPANIDDAIKTIELHLQASRIKDPSRVSAIEQRLIELRKMKEIFNGLTEEQKEVLNTITGIPIVVCGAGEAIALPKMGGGIGGGESAVKEMTVEVVATSPEHIAYVENMLKNFGRTDIRVIDINTLKSTDSLMNAIDGNADIAKEEFESIYPEEPNINLAVAGAQVQPLYKDREVVAVGDIHGNLEGLRDILEAAKLIKKGRTWKDDVWMGGNKVLINPGDIMDRGPQAKEARELLRLLDDQAKAQGGAVIRLFGNHDLAHMRGQFLNAMDVEDIDFWKKAGIKDFEEGRVRAAVVVNGRLWIHGLLDRENGMEDLLRSEIAAEHEINSDMVSKQMIADKINSIVADAIKNNKFDHPIFDVNDGIFWFRFRNVEQPNALLTQGVGHDVGRSVRIEGGHKLLGVDIGIVKGNLGWAEELPNGQVNKCKIRDGKVDRVMINEGTVEPTQAPDQNVTITENVQPPVAANTALPILSDIKIGAIIISGATRYEILSIDELGGTVKVNRSIRGGKSTINEIAIQNISQAIADGRAIIESSIVPGRITMPQKDIVAPTAKSDGEYSINDIIKYIERGNTAGIFYYRQLSEADQKKTLDGLSNQARLWVRNQLFFDRAPAMQGDANKDLNDRAKSNELSDLQKRIFAIGKELPTSAHGIEAGKGGLRNLLNIIFDGRIKSTNFGPLEDGNPQFMAGSHGPFYIIANPNAEQQRIENHLVYLVPEKADKDYLEQVLKSAVAEGIITAEVADNAVAKIITYQDFVQALGFQAAVAWGKQQLAANGEVSVDAIVARFGLSNTEEMKQRLALAIHPGQGMGDAEKPAGMTYEEVMAVRQRIAAPQAATPTRIEVIADILPLLEAPKIDRVALINAMADKANGVEQIQQILSEIETLPLGQRAEAQMALRTALAIKGVGDLEPGHLNIVVQCAGIGEGNTPTNCNRKIEDILSRRYNELLTKSIIGEDVKDVDALAKLLERARETLDGSKDPSNGRVLLLLPVSLQSIFWQAAEKAGISKGNIMDGKFKVQFVEQGAMPDHVSQFILGLEVLEYVRSGAKPEDASQRLVNLIAAMADGQDPKDILKKLFEFGFTLKIRKINWQSVVEQRKSWEAVATAL